MALQSRMTEQIGAESLEGEWEKVGSGGFGRVYKVRHKTWKFEVAIKLLQDDVGSFKKEANIMDVAFCPYVLRVFGIFEGRVPPENMSVQKGIVMEFMRRGSVQTLQTSLSGPPPWPLALRLAHEVALGVNFLHSKELVHSDLKPSNVLLDCDLHAKLADFGLSRVSTSALNNSNSNREATEEVGGSYKYMPPEAFEVSYELVRAFDTYSYGIFLWSIVTGKEPYETANYSLVALRIREGDRPSLEAIDQEKAEGLKELVDLMKECWDGNPDKRPTFKCSCLLF
uniref:Protein kinase domain-containing protein n=1 Tax=Anabas testudineus TaxID=64144 RepID=A0A3Q1H4F7_ANATE